MKLPRFQFSVRRMMIAIAVVPIAGVGAVELMRLRDRRLEYLGLAQTHALAVQRCRESARSLDAKIAWEEERLRTRKEEREGNRDLTEGELQETALELEQARRDAAGADKTIPYHTAMAEKYRRLARYPWLPVPPDPPEPK